MSLDVRERAEALLTDYVNLPGGHMIQIYNGTFAGKNAVAFVMGGKVYGLTVDEAAQLADGLEDYLPQAKGKNAAQFPDLIITLRHAVNQANQVEEEEAKCISYGGDQSAGS